MVFSTLLYSENLSIIYLTRQNLAQKDLQKVTKKLTISDSSVSQYRITKTFIRNI